jgi:ABC-2 type transport system permease protein
LFKGGKLLEVISISWYLVKLRMRTKLQYRSALVLSWVALAFGYAGDFTSFWIILRRFDGIAGWRWQEMALLLGFHTLGYAFGACFTFVQLRGMEDTVKHGEFDTLLIRPINPWVFMVFSGFNMVYVSHVLMGIGLLVWALPKVAIDWNFIKLLQFTASLVSASLLTGAIFTILGGCALVWRRARYIFNIYFDFWELSRYPTLIYAAPLKILLLTVVPLAYMAYVPVALLIGKPVPYLGSAAAGITVAVGPAAVLLAMLFWRFATRHYQMAE